MKKLALGIMTLAIIAASMPMTAFAQGSWVITQLNANTGNGIRPRIDGGYVVWQGHDGHDFEIYLYDGTGVTRVTDNESSDTSSMINGGSVVWYGYDEQDNEIYLYDITSRSTTQLTNNSYPDISPQVDGDKVVWQGYIDGDYEVFLYDIATQNTIQLTNNSYADEFPRINGDKVVWQGFDGHDFEIFLYDIASQITTQITNNAYLDQGPATDGSKVAWTGYDGHDDEIFLYDIASATTKNVSNNDFADSQSLDIDGGMVVWFGWSDVTDHEIYLYDGTGTIQITDNNYNDNGPRVDGGKITFTGYDDNDGEVFIYDIGSKVTTTLTDNNYGDYVSQIDDGTVVWYTMDVDVFNIFMAQQPGALKIFKFEDKNWNSVKDPTESVLPGWEFKITGPGGYNSSCITDASGLIELSNLLPGAYTVTEIPKPGGWVPTNGPGTRVEAVTPGGITTIEFGNEILPQTPAFSNLSVGLLIGGFAGIMMFLILRKRKPRLQI